MSGSTLSLEDLLCPKLLAFIQDSGTDVPRPTASSAPPTTQVGVDLQATAQAQPAATPSSGSSSSTPTAVATLNDVELQEFVEDQRNKNTKKKTKSDLSKWYTWCKSVGEERKLEELPHEDLDRLLGHFFMKVRKEDGSLYEPDTLTSFHRSIDRHLREDLKKPFSIIRDSQYSSSRETLKAARKSLKKSGKGNKSKAADPLAAHDFEQLWESGELGDGNPEALQNSIWLMLCMHMGMRGQDEHRKLRFGDLSLKSSNGSQYIEFNERDTKTRTGESGEKRAFQPKMWSTPSCPQRCPVRLFELYTSKRPQEMCKPDSPLYLAINDKYEAFGNWYKRQPMGVWRIGMIMKKMAEKAGLTGRKTNHSARKTAVENLCRAKVPDSQVMQFSGHRNVQSLNNYKTPSLEQQQEMSSILSSTYTGKDSRDETFRPQTQSNSHTPQMEQNSCRGFNGMFSGAQVSGCTFNFYISNASETSTTMASNCANITLPGPPQAKRPRGMDN